MERKITARNGIPIYSLVNKNNHSFYISMFLKSGVLYETDDECGITHFLEHAVIRNVNKLMDGELYAVLDRHGMEFNASTYNEMVQFYIFGSDKYFNIAAEIISKILSPIILSSEEIETERKRIKAEIREVGDKSSLAYFTAKEVWRDTSLSRPITGSISDLSMIGVRRLEDYRRRIFNSDNLFFYITGNVEDDNLSYLSELIGSYNLDGAEIHENKAKVPSTFFRRDKEVKIKNADFTKIRYTFDVDMSRVSSAELDLLYDYMLGGYNSEFFVELSEKRGLFYDLNGSVERYLNVATFSLSYELKESGLYEAARMTVELLHKYATGGLDTSRCMKTGYVDNAYMLYDDPRELNFIFGYENHINDLGYSGIEDRIHAYRELSLKRLCEVAAIVLDPRNMTVTLKGNKKKIDKERLNKILFCEV